MREPSPLQLRILSFANRVKVGTNISGQEIENFRCLGCGGLFDGTIHVNGDHHYACIWNYFTVCPDCTFESNLGAILGFGICRCHSQAN